MPYAERVRSPDPNTRPARRAFPGPAVVALCIAVTTTPACRVENGGAAPVLKVQGSTTVNPVVAEAAEILKRERDLRILVDPQGGSSGGIWALGEGLVDVAMCSKPISAEDRRRFPACDFREHPFAVDAVALVVSREVYAAGITELSREQVRGIFEGRITNWRQIGGADRAIYVYDKEPGRGTREVFARWAYGAQEPPRVSFRNYSQVGSNEETRNKVARHSSAIAQLSASWAVDQAGLRTVALRQEEGGAVAPTVANIRDGNYPLRRSLNLVTDGEPKGAARVLIEFLGSERGRELVAKHGYQVTAPPLNP